MQQNLLGVMELLGVGRRERRQRCDELLEQFKIAHLRKAWAGSLSGGERRRLEIARCLVSDPRIILLDEPFTGIDPVTIQNIQEIIRQLRGQGISILITDHQVRETLEITDRSYVISDGQVLCHGSRAEVLRIRKPARSTSATAWISARRVPRRPTARCPANRGPKIRRSRGENVPIWNEPLACRAARRVQIRLTATQRGGAGTAREHFVRAPMLPVGSRLNEGGLGEK